MVFEDEVSDVEGSLEYDNPSVIKGEIDELFRLSNTRNPGDRIVAGVDIVLLGQDGTGKASTVRRFLNDEWVGEEDDVESSFQKTVGLRKGGNVSLNIFSVLEGNTVFGTDKYRWIQDADCIFYMYDITDVSSFRELRYWLSLVERIRLDDEYVIVVCGSRLDACSIWRDQPLKKDIYASFCECFHGFVKKKVYLEPLVELVLDFLGEPPTDEVTTQEGFRFATEIDASMFTETSARFNFSIRETFLNCAELALEKYWKTKRSSCIMC